MVGIIVGSAESRHRELEEIGRLGIKHHKILINRVAEEIDADHWVSLHPEIFNIHLPGLKHSNLPYGNKVDCLWKFENKFGTSALFALYVAMRLLYKPVIFVGVPMSGKYSNPDYRNAWHKFKREYPEFSKSVYSFAGFTKELFNDIKDMEI